MPYIEIRLNLTTDPLDTGTSLVLIQHETLKTHCRYRCNMRLCCSSIFKRGNNPRRNIDNRKNDESDLRKRSKG